VIFWICGILATGAAIMAAFLGDVRRAVLALWITGLAVGGVYLGLGAELLAVVQWIVSTVVAISFIFYAVMFGEYGLGDERPPLRRAFTAVLPMLLGLAFMGVVWLGTQDLAAPEAGAGGPGLARLGQLLMQEHFISLEVLGLTLFLMIVGSGVIARPERKTEEERP
jgi:NADH:ubiquinone oxidoreductase subunit 6 (subunit J)